MTELNDDLQLVEACQKGDQMAFEQLVLKHQKRVFNIVYRFLGDYEEAKDLTQEVFIRVYKAIKGFRKEAQFSTWVYYITCNTCRNKLRQWKTRPMVESLDKPLETDENEINITIPDTTIKQPDEALEQKEIQTKVQQAIQTLSEDHKTVIILRDIQNLSYEEIAQVLNCSLGTVKSRLARARLALKDKLKEVIKNEL